MNLLTDVTQKAQRFLSYFQYHIKKSDYSDNYYVVMNDNGKTFGKFLYKRDKNNFLYFKLDFASVYGDVIAYIRNNFKSKKNLEIHFKIRDDKHKKYTVGRMTLADTEDTYTSKKNPCFLVMETSRIINDKLYPYKNVNIGNNGVISFYNLLRETGVIINLEENKLCYYIGEDKKLEIEKRPDSTISIKSENILINEKYENKENFYETCFDILPEIFDFIKNEITSYESLDSNIVLEILLENIEKNQYLRKKIKSINKKKVLK